MNAASEILKSKAASLRADAAAMEAKASLIESLIDEIEAVPAGEEAKPVEVAKRSAPSPVIGPRPQPPGDETRSQKRIIAAAKLLSKGPRSISAIVEAVDASYPTVAAMLNNLPYFEKIGTGRLDPWKLSADGVRFLETMTSGEKS